MLAHALSILVKELNDHFNNIQPGNTEDTVVLGNIAALESDVDPSVKNQLRNKVVVTALNLREEKTLKNTPHYRVNDALKTEYFNPPIFVNVLILFSATTTSSYENALIYLSRLIRFFQSKNIFTPLNTAAPSPANPYDAMQDFKLILDLYSPTLEEENQMWGMLGGKQHPSVIYNMRLLELKREDSTAGFGVISEVEGRFNTIVNTQ